VSTPHLRRICVYCGSNLGTRPAYVEHTRRLGQLLAERGIGVVYGGGSVGLMGVLADAVVRAGGEVIGVIPQVLIARERGAAALGEVRVVTTMHERKALMVDLSDAFVALPGGFGTLDELFEVVSWARLGIHRKPIGLLNTEGFFEPLLNAIKHAVAEGFIKPLHTRLLTTAADPETLLAQVISFRPPAGIPRWATRAEV
jgi:uncharacterized protein (TIGR00730 family)